MSDEESIRDKYKVPPGNLEAEFVDGEGLVLANKLGITILPELQFAEEETLAYAYEILLSGVRMDTPLSSDFLQRIHSTIFGDVFEWAGRWRTVQISNPGAIWPPPANLESARDPALDRAIKARTRSVFVWQVYRSCFSLWRIR